MPFEFIHTVHGVGFDDRVIEVVQGRRPGVMVMVVVMVVMVVMVVVVMVMVRMAMASSI